MKKVKMMIGIVLVSLVLSACGTSYATCDAYGGTKKQHSSRCSR